MSIGDTKGSGSGKDHGGSKGYLLAVDVGTTTARAMLFDLEGRPVAEAFREVQVLHPRPSWAELDAELCWQKAVTVIREVLQRSQVRPDRIQAIGLTSLLHAMVPVDRAGKPLARAMLWMDQRCAPQAAWMQREHGDVVERCTGRRRVTTTPSAPKLRWIAEHDPGLLRRTHKFLSIKDFVRLRLSGAIATDPSDASGTGLFDREHGEWALPILEILGVPVDKMAPIRSSSEVVGRVTAEAAAATGLLEGTPIGGGGGDTTCTRIGANALGTGRACLYLGTAAWISVPERRAGAFGTTATTGATLRWLVELFKMGRVEAPGDAYRALQGMAEGVAPGAEGLLFLPHLMGERGPVPDPQAKGVLFGLSLAHGRAEVTRAILEGCAFHLRSILDSLTAGPVAEMVVVGGGAKGALWREIIADVTGTTLLVPQVLEAGALGAAILAGIGVGVYPGAQEAASQLVRIVKRQEPGAAKHALYSRIYAVYQELEERMAPLYSKVPVETCEEG